MQMMNTPKDKPTTYIHHYVTTAQQVKCAGSEVVLKHHVELEFTVLHHEPWKSNHCWLPQRGREPTAATNGSREPDSDTSTHPHWN